MNLRLQLVRGRETMFEVPLYPTDRVERGKYRCSPLGWTGFILMSFAFKKLMEFLEERKRF